MRKTLTLTSILAFSVLLFSGFILNSSTEILPAKFKFTKKVDKIVQGKCYGCHSEKGRSDKAKEKLMWDDLSGMAEADRKKKLEKVKMMVEKGAMPPARMVERNPDLKLTEKETKALRKWAMKHSK